MLRCFSTGDSAARADRVVSERNILGRLSLFLGLARRLPHTRLAIGSPIEAVKGPDRSRQLALAARALSHGGTIMNPERTSAKNLVRNKLNAPAVTRHRELRAILREIASQPASGIPWWAYLPIHRRPGRDAIWRRHTALSL